MATISKKVPYFVWRQGRPRWIPGPGVRKLGFKGADLQDPLGNWLELEAAIARAEELNAEVEAYRKAGKPKATSPKPPKQLERSCAALIDAWERSEAFAKLKPKTQRDYRSKAAVFLEDFGEHHVGAVEPPHIYGFWEEMVRTRGHAMANGVIAVVRAAFSHGRRIGWRKDNPAERLRLASTAPRLVIWTPEEVLAGVAAADAIGLPSVGDAIVTALHSGQRQGDVLVLEDHIFEDQRIRLSQSKRGAKVDAPMTPQLLDRVNRARERKRAAGVTTLDTLIVYENTGLPYKGDLFRKKFALARDKAAEECPSIKGRTFQDLRDTAVTRLGTAGCTVPQIAAITGHSAEHVHSVLKHYLALNSDMADEAIRRLVAWMQEEGIKL